MNSADSRPSRAVNLPDEIINTIGFIARSKGITIRGFIIDVLEGHIKEKYPNIEQVMKLLEVIK